MGGMIRAKTSGEHQRDYQRFSHLRSAGCGVFHRETTIIRKMSELKEGK